MSLTSRETDPMREPHPAEVQILSPWLSSQEACAYLRFTGADRLHSLYRFIQAHGITKRYRSPKRLLLKRADLDRALDGAPRRRNAVKKAQAA